MVTKPRHRHGFVPVGNACPVDEEFDDTEQLRDHIYESH
jgi:hypothetical protein